LVPESISAAMLAGDPPYDGIDAIFVSHVHGDHFTAEPAVAYLRAHPEVPLYGSAQTRLAIVEAVGADDPVLQRVVTVDIGPQDSPRQFELHGLIIDVVAIPHAGNRPEIQNLAWRVTLDGQTTVTHFGDAATVASDFERHADHFAARHSQAAFPPHWFFEDEQGRAIMDRYFNADQIIGIHVPAAAAGHGDALRARLGGDLFTDPGEARELDKAAPDGAR
ncbi:MAG: MBL fold metallo-hydrolase, partial [Xanthomonadales bacterium]|nr:MBL fold metallo-hydrolase [Xanthomonadales bacterium]